MTIFGATGLERELLKLLNINLIIDEKMNSLISNFIKHEESKIESFCNIQGIHKRKFERFANKILGINQMHFIKEFKLFTGSSPTQFLVEKKSLRQICFLVKCRIYTINYPCLMLSYNSKT